jgi:glycosyltransferase involved in cell wall biosynthesis
MRIGINALYLLPGKVGGSETYIRSLVENLARLDTDNTYFIFVNTESAGVFREAAPRVNVVRCPLKASNRPARILWEQLILPFQVRKRRLDVLLSAGMTAPVCRPAKSVLVIFDLQHINQPRNFPAFQLFFLRTIIYWSAKTADKIITISGHVKKDIVRHYHTRPDEISVTYLGVNHAAFFPRPDTDADAVRTKYRLPDRYFLYAAALLPHKNHERLLEAFKDIRNEIPETKLVLTGAWEAGREKVLALIAELGLEQDVILLGWLPFEDIPAIYRGAELFVYPTLHEGFGLPVLEAMACGVPVVCSRIEPLLEVAGDAAVLVDPYDTGDIARGMKTAARDERLRKELIEKGLLRARAFTWGETALATLEVLGKRKGNPA